jgi:hypothetical protein
LDAEANFSPPKLHRARSYHGSGMWDESDDDDDDDDGGMMSSYRATRKYKKAKTLQNFSVNFGGGKTYAQQQQPPAKPKSAPLPTNTNATASRPLSAAAAVFKPAAATSTSLSSSSSSSSAAATSSSSSDAQSPESNAAANPYTRNLYIRSDLAGRFVGPRGAHMREIEARDQRCEGNHIYVAILAPSS